jgi:prophage regulatory protein
MNKIMAPNTAHSISNLPDDALIKLPTVLALGSYSRSDWYKGIKEGKYPRPIKRGTASRWVLGEIRAIVEAETNSTR